MLTRRVIACLDVDGGRVVKGVQFQSLRDVGDPVELAEGYEREGADEIVFLDIAASAEGRETMLDVVRRTAERLFIPLTLRGGQGQYQLGIGGPTRTAERVRRPVWMSMRGGEHRRQARGKRVARVHPWGSATD